MAWSTREIADLAGTSLRAVRHYHEVGLLAEPERLANGYKQYGVAHLVRLLRIKRLVDLGFSLAQIAEMGDDDHHPEQALRTLDAELAATIEQLQRARIELGLILRHRASPDLPAGMVPGSELTEADRALVLVMSRVLGPKRLEAYSELLRSATSDPTDGEFDELPADADADVRADLARRMAPHIRRIRQEHALAVTSDPGNRPEDRLAEQVAAQAMHELYNPAQLDVLRRVRELLADE
ncbi:MerR family transcriptional regulator [Pseudonocardia sp. NPDC049635]|uniref:helix-turn-helix domain-containing protein n=1 Tax=Pseudonocardia sp. NPDC049635 TaxID=3155506 RepID=UPI0033C8CB57